MSKASNNMHLILSYQIRQPTINMKFCILKKYKAKAEVLHKLISIFTIFRCALTFRCHTKRKSTHHSFIESSQHFLNGNVL